MFSFSTETQLFEVINTEKENVLTFADENFYPILQHCGGSKIPTIII